MLGGALSARRRERSKKPWARVPCQIGTFTGWRCAGCLPRPNLMLTPGLIIVVLLRSFSESLTWTLPLHCCCSCIRRNGKATTPARRAEHQDRTAHSKLAGARLCGVCGRKNLTSDFGTMCGRSISRSCARDPSLVHPAQSDQGHVDSTNLGCELSEIS